MGSRIDLAGEVAALVDALKAQGLAAAVDPADLAPPCVWVTCERIIHDRLAGATMRMQLLLIVDDRDTLRAWEALSVLLADVEQVVSPTSDTTADSVTLPGDSTPLPALVLTHDLLADQINGTE